MDGARRREAFSELLTQHQGALYGYIFALVRNQADTEDLFQATSLVMWRKFDTFDPGTNFLRWGQRIAAFEVRNFVRRKQLPLAPNSAALLDELTAVDCEAWGQADSYQLALRRCLGKLASPWRNLLELYYVDNCSSQRIAEQTNRSRQSVANSLLRIRRKLFTCIQRELAGKAES